MLLNVETHSACNLRCRFCYQTHEKEIDFSNLDYVIETLPEFLKRNPTIDIHGMRLVGGECLMDNIKTFEQYYRFYDKICEIVGKPLPTRINTNGVFTKTQRVKELLSYVNGKLIFSYDSVDRFSSERQRNLCLSNIETFSEYIKEPIIIILKPHDMFDFIDTPTFKFFYDNYGIEYQECVPDLYSVNNKLADFWIYLLKLKYFKIKNISDFCDCYLSELDSICNKGIMCFNHSIYCGCHFTLIPIERLKMTCENRLNCYYCEYKPNCYGVCWFSSKDKTVCEKKSVYDFLKQNPNILKDYECYKRSKNSTTNT